MAIQIGVDPRTTQNGRIQIAQAVATEQNERKGNNIKTVGLGNTETKNEPYKAPEETRADKIYEEQKDREDTAWQRGVKDMLASGVNPNLVSLGFNGATTGAGIMADQELQGEIDQILKSNEIKLQGEVNKMLMKLDQEFKMNESQKDRWNKTINQLISTAGTIVGSAMKAN